MSFNNQKNTIGFNLAAVKFYKQKLEENESIRLFADLTLQHNNKTRKNKQKQVALVNLKSASSVTS